MRPTTQPVAVEAPVEVPEAPTLFDQHLDSVNFEQIGLADAIQSLRDKTGQNIFVNWRALEETGVKRDTPVTARLRDVKLGAALRSILADAGGGHVELGCTIDDGVITISTANNLRQNFVTRVYDIRDLLVVSPDFEAGPGEPAPTIKPTRQELVSSVEKLICETIDADHWTESDEVKFPNRMREMAGQLIVTAPPPTHEEIIRLLDQLRENRAVQIILEARFISIDLDQLPKPLATSLRQTFEQNKPNEVKSAYLSEEQTTDLIHHAQKLPDSSLISAPRITLFNGQRAWVRVTTAQSYVGGFTVIKSDAHEQRYEPKIETVEFGVQLDARATASANRKFVTVTIHPTLSRLMGIKSEPYKDAKDLMVQVPMVSTQSLNTTVNIPDRQTCIVGGLIDREVIIEGKPNPVSRPIFLLVKPSLIVQREVASR